MKAALLGILVQCLKGSGVAGCERGLAALTNSGGSFPGAARAVPRVWSWCELWEPEEQHLWQQHTELCVMIPGVLLGVSVTHSTEVSVVLLQSSFWILWSCYNGNSVHSVATAKIHYPSSCLPTLPFKSVWLQSKVLWGIKK